jgi:peptidoglycan/LPS O-acetylase OafA/YrhL
MQRAGYSLFALAGAGLVIVAVTTQERSVWQRVLRAGWLRAFGNYSYAEYLIHLPVSRILQEVAYGPDQFPMVPGGVWIAQLAFYALATMATFVLAWVSWHTFEAPLLRLKARFPYREEQAFRAP